jgi:citrate synthase
MTRRTASPDAPRREAADETRHGPRHAWRTAVTHVEPNRILVRGYALDELMGRVSFAEAVYLLLEGELPTPALGRLMDAMLVSLVDHGTSPPSTLAARNVATAGAPLRASVAAGVLGFGTYHGGDIEGCVRLLEQGVAMVREGTSHEVAARRLVEAHAAKHEAVPGFGHRMHTHDPRAARLFQMALELEVDGAHLRMLRALEHALNQGRAEGHGVPVNVDGAIAAVCADIGLGASVGHALFIISRVPGLIAQAREEQERERPMRQIDSTAAIYDGPRERRLPGTRK